MKTKKCDPDKFKNGLSDEGIKILKNFSNLEN